MSKKITKKTKRNLSSSDEHIPSNNNHVTFEEEDYTDSSDEEYKPSSEYSSSEENSESLQKESSESNSPESLSDHYSYGEDDTEESSDSDY
jgi:hypothetical protein